jgi:hypothetical protein
LKNCIFYKNFNVSPMKVYKRPMNEYIDWLWWHKVWWKPKWSNFGIFSTKNLGIKCGMPCYFNSHNPLWQMCSNYRNASRWTWWSNEWLHLGMANFLVWIWTQDIFVEVIFKINGSQWGYVKCFRMMETILRFPI